MLKSGNLPPQPNLRQLSLGLIVCIAFCCSLPSGMTQDSGVFLPSNRQDSRGIQQVQQLIARGEYSQAIRFLDEVLAREEDSFVETSEGEFSGLKATASQILRDLPDDGRRMYEATYGPVARRLLGEAVSQGDAAKLREVFQRYYNTPAGYEAALLFAKNESDAGRHLTASLVYQQLLATPEAVRLFEPQLTLAAAASWIACQQPDNALPMLQKLKDDGYAEVQFSGQSRTLNGNPEAPLAWIREELGRSQPLVSAVEQQWLTTRGNASRNGNPVGGLPHLRVRWQVRLLGNKNLEAVHDEMADVLARQQKPQLPAATPLAVGNYIITRSAHGLIAVDFRTGKRVWQAQPQREAFLQELMDSSQWQEDNENGAQAADSFARLIWEDYLYSAISSDGERVFVIRDLSMPRLQRRDILPFMPDNLEESTGSETNRLCAYELATQGKLVWEIDGAARSDSLKGVFFLGAPVTVGQSLYCLAEIQSETAIYLISLDRQTGELRWKQQLADLEQGITLDTNRRLQGAVPAYDAGMLICPTGSGVVVAVDLAKRALAWAYSYPTISTPLIQLGNRRNRVLNLEQQWAQSVPVIAEGCVLLTPRESKWLHCLDLRTGRVLWKKPRGDALLLAGVYEQKVLLVGNENISALRLQDGEPCWDHKSLQLTELGIPTGSGFFSDGNYYLPLSNASVVGIDLARGKIVSRAQSREDQQLGNLICFGGSVISQTGRYVDCFDQVEVLRRRSQAQLVQNPRDAEALCTLGEIAYNEGKIPQAIELLSAAFEADGENLRTREVLGEALVFALDESFADFQQYLPLLGKIQPETPVAQLTQLRLQLQGMLQMGRAVEAFDLCLKAFQELRGQEIELPIGQDYQVQAERWLSGQVQAAWDTASLDERAVMDEHVQPFLSQTRQSDDVEAMRLFYDCFASLASVEFLGLELSEKYLVQGQTLSAQQLLMTLTDATDATIRNASVAYCSQLLHEAELPRLAVEFDKQLRGPLANEICLQGRTGLECLASWEQNASVSDQSWPYGRVEVSFEDTTTPQNSRARQLRTPYMSLQLEQTDSVLGSCNLMQMGVSTGRNRELQIQDGHGRVFYRANLDQSRRALISSRGSEYGVSRGNLLIVSLGRQLAAFDTLSSGEEALWRKNTSSSLQYDQEANLRRTIGGRRIARAQNDGFVIGIIGAVTRDSCIYQEEERLICVDALSGELRWARSGIPRGCDLFGDERCVLVVPPDSNRALVFSTQDGRQLLEGQQNLPDWEERIATVGRQVIVWRKQESREWVLTAYDALEDQVVWRHAFEGDARIDVADNRFAAVAGPAGTCAILDLSSGEKVVDSAIKKNISLQKVHLLVGSDDFVLAVEQPFGGPRQLINQFNSRDYTDAPFAAQIYLFDRSKGEAVWESPAEVSGLPMMLSQPADLPIISFAGKIHRQDKQGSKQELGVLLLEKASGRVLYENLALPRSRYYPFLSSSEEEPNEVVLDMLNQKLRLKFTGKPRAPEPPMVHHVQRSSGISSKGLQNILDKIFGGQ